MCFPQKTPFNNTHCSKVKARKLVLHSMLIAVNCPLQSSSIKTHAAVAETYLQCNHMHGHSKGSLTEFIRSYSKAKIERADVLVPMLHLEVYIQDILKGHKI